MKRLISLIVSIVLTVSVFTAAYATESMTGTSEEVAPIVEVVAKEGETTGEKSGSMTQTESDLAQTEISDQDLRIVVIQYAKELTGKYFPPYAKRPKGTVFPKELPIIIDANVDQSIAFLQAKRAEHEAEVTKLKAELDEARRKIDPEVVRKVVLIPFLVPIFIELLLFPYHYQIVTNQFLAAQYRALVEAKQYYDYKLGGNEELPAAQ